MRRVAIALAVVLLGVVTGCGAGAGGGPSSDAVSVVPSSTGVSVAPSSAVVPVAPSSAASPEPSGAGSPAPSLRSASNGAATPSSVTVGAAPNPGPTATAAPAGGFTGSIAGIDAATAARMATSWRPGCPVPLADLRDLTLTYRGFDGADHAGELVVAASVADEVVAIFRRLYVDGYPIGSMRLVDDFGGNDDASMAANNTSAFNCRPVTGGGGFSEHSYGTAIDVNPVQNPYLSGSTVLPPAGEPYVDRPDEPGVIHDGDGVVAAFAAHGFSWGGDWTGPIDYQHFSVSGR